MKSLLITLSLLFITPIVTYTVTGGELISDLIVEDWYCGATHGDGKGKDCK